MKNTQLISLALFAFLFVVAPTATFGQDEKKKQQEPTEESKAELQDAMDGLTTALKNKEADEAKSMIDKISTKYQGGDDKQKKTAVALLKGCLKKKDKSIRTSAISALGNTGGSAIKILMKGAKASKKDPGLQQRYLNSAGKLRDEKVVPEFIKYLNNKDNNTIKTAIYALGRYNKSSTKLRKDIVKSLLRQYASIASAYNQPNPDSGDKKKYQDLYNPFESTLKKLTKQEMKGCDVWNKWFRKDGKKRKEW